MLSNSNLAAAMLVVAACGADAASVPACVPSSTAPTYSQLYTKYFAVDTPGHCANNLCHGGAQFTIWLCGNDKDTCYQGMTSAASGLIDTMMPNASLMIDARSSPLSWF